MLFDIPENPIPANAIAGVFAAADGKKLRYARFGSTAGSTKGTVVVLAGRGECIEKYFETAGDLTAMGFDVAALDWRGQGGSDRVHRDPERGHIRDFSVYAADLDKFFDDVLLPDYRGPFHVLGHSTGGLIALLAAPRLGNRVRRMVLSAPFLALAEQPLSMTAIHRLATLLSYTGLGGMYVSGGAWTTAPFEGNKLTSDPRRYERNLSIYRQHSKLRVGGPTVAWIRAACAASTKVCDPDFQARIRFPVLCIAAGADRIVSTRATEVFMGGLRSGSMLTVDGARHEILQEADRYRQQFLAAFDAFVPGLDIVD